MSIYSSLFWTGNAPAGNTTVYTVPADYVVVIRDVEWHNATAPTGGAQLGINVPGFNAAQVCGVNAVATGDSAQWQGRVVCPAGTQIQTQLAAAVWYVTISGYLLQ